MKTQLIKNIKQMQRKRLLIYFYPYYLEIVDSFKAFFSSSERSYSTPFPLTTFLTYHRVPDLAYKADIITPVSSPSTKDRIKLWSPPVSLKGLNLISPTFCI